MKWCTNGLYRPATQNIAWGLSFVCPSVYYSTIQIVGQVAVIYTCGCRILGKTGMDLNDSSWPDLHTLTDIPAYHYNMPFMQGFKFMCLIILGHSKVSRVYVRDHFRPFKVSRLYGLIILCHYMYFIILDNYKASNIHLFTKLKRTTVFKKLLKGKYM